MSNSTDKRHTCAVSPNKTVSHEDRYKHRGCMRVPSNASMQRPHNPFGHCASDKSSRWLATEATLGH